MVYYYNGWLLDIICFHIFFCIKQHFGDYALPWSSGKKCSQLGSIDGDNSPRMEVSLVRNKGLALWTGSIEAESSLRNVGLIKNRAKDCIQKL
jgi:hypothetical protein